MISVSPFFRSSKISFDKSSFFLHNSQLVTPFSGVVIQGFLYEGLFFCSFWGDERSFADFPYDFREDFLSDRKFS